MKKKIQLLVLSLLVSGFSYAQTEPTDFTGRDTREREQAPQTDQMNFVPNEILVKFKDDVNLSTGSQLKSTGIKGIDQVLKSAEIVKLEKLFPQAQKLKSAQAVKLPTGEEMTIPSLHNIYKIVLPELKSNQPQTGNIYEYINELKQQPEVEYAEPNYIYSIGDFTPAGPEMTMLEAMEQPANDNVAENATGLIPNDPLYNSQWGIPACNIDDVWNTTTGDSTSIIAILDTGVDDEHPDLKKNIWKNDDEIPGNGIDDDGNGKVDDTWGWDFINEDNSPKDDNSHGTHVAGIAAAVGGNGIGIAGVNWKAKILPVKVFQSSGRGDAATIAQGVTYATNNGATVLNMSFGSYAESLSLKNALANAYATAVLVAAAGNDALCIGPGFCPDKKLGARMFPGAYSFVLGVEANTNSIRAGFSNFDQDGPVFSSYTELENYELKAPGIDIISCVPGGNYREYNGTSMAAPFVAGAVSLYRQQKPTESQEMLFGNFINSINQHIDLEAALSIVPEPELNIVSYELQDTIDGDRDGRPDAGETIELQVTVRNTWGQANDVMVGIDFAEFEDQLVADFLLDSALVGSVSSYASRFNAIPLKIKIDENLADGRDIMFELNTYYGSHQGEKKITTKISIENGVELKGVINDDLTLYPDKHYIITENLAINENVTIIIKPGTTLKFAEGKSLVTLGNVIAIGTPDSLITLTKRDLSNSWNNISVSGNGLFILDYGKILYAGKNGIQRENIINTNWSSTRNVSITNTIFSYNYGYIWNARWALLDKNVFTLSNFPSYIIDFYNAEISNNNFINNPLFDDHSRAINHEIAFPENFKSNCIFSNYRPDNRDVNIMVGGSFTIKQFSPNYFGTTNEEKIDDGIYDFGEDASRPLIDVSNKLDIPPKENHGIVWKVLVNGKDAQDEFDQLDPLGVGLQKFEVYFNRPMDVQYPPTVSMGVRYPYTQTAIATNGSWSADSTIYSVYGNIGLTTGDGINTIRVIGSKDNDHFEIPIEDRRFRVIVDATGSASTEFQATAGLGKVALEWNKADLQDGLGFNMYRKEQINDSTLSQSVMINSTLVTDTVYTDFAVTPNKKYFYYYKILRTNLTETDSSKMVAAIPFTAALGDSNGDLSVNVLDVTTIVAYLLNQNPQPFIFEAADVNGDGQINVLDIVATVNKVLNPDKSAVIASAGTVNLYLQNDTLFVDTPVPVGAIQFDITNVTGIEEIEKLKALQGLESGYSINDNTLRLIVYSLAGKTIPAGNRIPLLRMKKGSGITNMIMGDKTGSPLTVNYLSTGLWNLRELGNEVASLGQNYPNPFDKTTTIPVMVNEPVDELVVRIINITGQEAAVLPLKNPVVGENLLHWNTNGHKGMLVYRLEIMREGKMAIAGVKKMIVNQ